MFKTLNPIYNETFTFTGLNTKAMEAKKLWYRILKFFEQLS